VISLQPVHRQATFVELAGDTSLAGGGEAALTLFQQPECRTRSTPPTPRLPQADLAHLEHAVENAWPRSTY